MLSRYLALSSPQAAYMRRTIRGLIVGGNHYPLLMATNVWALPTIAGRPCPLSFPLSLSLIQGLNAPIISLIGLLPGLLVILSLPNGPYKRQQRCSGLWVLE